MLFANFAGEDATLAKQQEFKQFIIPILKTSYAHFGGGFERDVKQYVAWNTASIHAQAVKIHIWHSDADNW